MSKTKLVVFDNHTLGYITPEQPEIIQILHTSILKGSRFTDRSTIYVNMGIYRLATEQDFEDFRCVFSDGYKNSGDYVYQK